jgi:hypothetical protein
MRTGMQGISASALTRTMHAEVTDDFVAEAPRGASQCCHEEDNDGNNDRSYGMEVEDNDNWIREVKGTGKREGEEGRSTQGSDAGRPHKKRKGHRKSKRNRSAPQARNDTQDEEELVREGKTEECERHYATTAADCVCA